MSGESLPSFDVQRFVLNQVETVPHLEALLLLWNNRPKQWSEQELSASLYIGQEETQTVVQDLLRRQLIARDGENGRYGYAEGSEERGRLMEELAAAYRQDLISLTRLIHSKSSPAREFARAFRFTKRRK